MTFTVQDGLIAQRIHVAQLHAALSHETYQELLQKCFDENKKLTTESLGQDVFRGVLIYRWLLQRSPLKIERV